MHSGSDTDMMAKKKVNEKNTKNKIKNECAFLYFLANNNNEKQTKQFLSYFTNSKQYTLLRELVVNDLAENIPDYNLKKIKNKLKKSMKYRIECLAHGELKKHNLHNIYPFIKILATNVLRYYGITDN